MSKENKTVELKEEDLQEVSGGGGFIPMMHVVSPCGDKTFWVSAGAPPAENTYIGECKTHGWKATFVEGIKVSFYNESTGETAEGQLSDTW